jgi:hypothetical protein
LSFVTSASTILLRTGGTEGWNFSRVIPITPVKGISWKFYKISFLIITT